jgi:hypothetical protein
MRVLGMGTARLAGALAALASAVVVAPASGAPRCGEPGQIVTMPDKWVKIAAPEFGAGGQTMTDYDVLPFAPSRLVVTNGTSLVFTSDGGCHWTPSKVPDTVALPTLPTGGEAGRIVSSGISQVRFAQGASATAFALGQTNLVTDGVPATQPRVLRSADGGNLFEDFTEGLPRFGRPVAVRTDGDIAVLIFHETAPIDTWTIYTSTGGAWEARWEDTGALTDLTVDFTYGDVWAWNGAGLRRANLNTAAEPVAVPGVTGNVKAVDVSPKSYGVSTVSVFFASGGERMVSDDRGVTFRQTPAPEGVQSVAHSDREGMLAISSVETNVLIENPIRADADFSPASDNVSALRFASFSFEGRGYPLYALNPLHLFLRMVPPDFEPPPPPPVPVDVEVEPVPIVRPKPDIQPRGRVVPLKPGERTTVDFTVKLPPVPTPLDVYFMTDSTSSMDGAIASVQEGVQEIVNALAARGVDLHFGVADFRDYPETPTDGSAMYPYKQRRKVGPVDSDLEDALQNIGTAGGTTDGFDAALEATRQALTGAGSKSITGEELIKPGLDAGFRKDAMKVILAASDDDMRHGGITNPTYPGPSLEEVEGLLRSPQYADVDFVGIEVDTNSGDPRTDMEKLARAAGTVAPAEGVDCDDDGSPDIDPGDPIVCTFAPGTGGSIAPAFISMLNSIKDFATVDIEVDGPENVVHPLAQTSFPNIDVKKPSTYTVPVEFSCDLKQAGTETPVTVTVTSRGRDIVSTDATVRCIAPPVPKRRVPPVIEELIPPPAIPPLVAAELAPPAPPPAPVSNAQPNPNPNPNPNPQLNANTGMASQEDQQHQLALAELDVHANLDGGEELAFSALETQGPVYPALAWATAAAMTLAAGYGTHLARRNATAPARAFNPRDHR